MVARLRFLEAPAALDAAAALPAAGALAFAGGAAAALAGESGGELDESTSDL